MKQKLTSKEEMLMNIFWEHGSMFIRDLISYIPEPKPHYNTVATLVKFLEEKGFVEREPMANSFRYKVKISEKQYRGKWWPGTTTIPTRLWFLSSWRMTR